MEMLAMSNWTRTLRKKQPELSDVLQRQIGEVIDLLRYRVPSLGVAKSVEGLRSDFWKIRMDAMSKGLLTTAPYNIERVLADMKAELDSFQDDFTEVSQFAWEIYREAALSTTTKIGSEYGPIPPDADLSYQSLNGIMKMIPALQAQWMLYWINHSLDMNMTMVVLHEHRNQPIVGLDKTELKAVLKRTSELYGAYAILLGFWEPGHYSENQPIHNAILVAASLSPSTSQPLSTSELAHSFN
jgi:hypothetical protein